MLGKLLDRLDNTYAHIASEAVRLARDASCNLRACTLLVKLLDWLEVSSVICGNAHAASEAVRLTRHVSYYLR